MTSLILMYVFFDKNGDIKAITPSLDEQFSNCYSATFPIADVEMFLSAEKNTFDYNVKKIEKFSGITYKIVRKKVHINYTRTLDSYLTKILPISKDNNTIMIINDPTKKLITIELNKEYITLYRELMSDDIDDTDESDDTVNSSVLKFFNMGPSTIYVTKNNNPYHLLHSISFTPREFIAKEKLYFNYTGDYTNVSLYTKKLIGGYGFSELATYKV